jgi:hypothetical protein
MLLASNSRFDAFGQSETFTAKELKRRSRNQAYAAMPAMSFRFASVLGVHEFRFDERFG